MPADETSESPLGFEERLRRLESGLSAEQERSRLLGDTHEAAPNLHTYLVEAEEEKLSQAARILKRFYTFPPTNL